MLERIGRDSPKLVEDLVPKTLSLTALQKVLQGLLAEEVPIRDMRTIIIAAEHGCVLPRRPPPVASPTSRN